MPLLSWSLVLRSVWASPRRSEWLEAYRFMLWITPSGPFTFSDQVHHQVLFRRYVEPFTVAIIIQDLVNKLFKTYVRCSTYPVVLESGTWQDQIFGPSWNCCTLRLESRLL